MVSVLIFPVCVEGGLAVHSLGGGTDGCALWVSQGSARRLESAGRSRGDGARYSRERRGDRSKSALFPMALDRRDPVRGSRGVEVVHRRISDCSGIALDSGAVHVV